MENFDYIRKNYEELCSEIDLLAKKAGQEITLVAVTKSGSDEELVALIEAGASDMGENRPQELVRRGELLKEKGLTPRLHEIGNLQRNKVKSIIGSVALIHSVDGVELAEEIGKRASAIGRVVPILIEVNSAKEEAKGGIMPDAVEDFYLKIREIEGISVEGIMTMGPVTDDPEEIRPYFRLTKEIFDRLNEKYGFKNGGILSMGMSDSYRVAIEEGSTLVRVGRRLFQK